MLPSFSCNEDKGGRRPMDKPRTSVVLCALLAIVLLALGVCALHWVNAVSPKGTMAAGSCVMTDGAAENLRLLVEDPWKAESVIHISGALMRMDQPVGDVNMRVGLMDDAHEDDVIVLSTQMVRRPELAQTYGCDDHCGFHASVDAGKLEKTTYRVVVLDEVSDTVRLLQTGLTVTLGRDAFIFEHDSQEGDAE